MSDTPLKVSIKQLERSEEQTRIKFRNVDVNVKVNYLKSLKNPDKWIRNLWHKKTETQIRYLAKENRLNEIKGLVSLQIRKGFEITHVTTSLIDSIEAEIDEISLVVNELFLSSEKKNTVEVVTVNEKGEIEIDDIYI